jgi:hypothetical protein
MAADEIYGLADDLNVASREVLPAAREAMGVLGQRAEDDWRAAAESRYDMYGRHYPKSITHDVRFTLGGAVEAEIYPDPAKRQGSMSFEFGSKNQPAHLDGANTTRKLEKVGEALIVSALGRIIP